MKKGTFAFFRPANRDLMLVQTPAKHGACAQFPPKLSLNKVCEFLKIFTCQPKVKTVAERLSFISSHMTSKFTIGHPQRLPACNFLPWHMQSTKLNFSATIYFGLAKIFRNFRLSKAKALAGTVHVPHTFDHCVLKHSHPTKFLTSFHHLLHLIGKCN